MNEASPPAGSLQRARLLVELGRLAEARREVERHLAQHSDDADGWAYHALWLRRDDPATAEASAARAITLRPDSAWVHMVMAQVAGEAGRRHVSIPAAQRAVALAPYDAHAHSLLAQELSHRLGRRREAMRSAQEALRLAPDDPDVLLTVGNVQLALGKAKQAERAYRAVLAQEPENAIALHNLSLCHSARRNHANAIDILHYLVRSDPRAEGARQQFDRSISDLFREFQWLAFFVAFLLAVGSQSIWDR